MGNSKNKKKISVEYKSNSKVSKLHEPFMHLSTIKPMSLIKEFNYKEFKKISADVPFTLKEWSDILHISERTLQRYAKANRNFTFSVTDRILQIDKVIKRGLHVFGSMEKFMGWLRENPFMLEGRLSLQSLSTIDGINKILTQLGRIEHGILA